MRDRIDEYNEKLAERTYEVRQSIAEIATDTYEYVESEAAVFVKNFLKKVGEIYKMFSALDQKIKDVMEMQSAILEFSKTDESLEKKLDVTKFYGSDTELRICSTQLLTLKRKLTCSVSSYYKIQEEYKEKTRDRVKRQAEISGADIDSIDFDSAIETKTDFFLQTIFPDFNVAHQYMHEIRKRHEEFLKLESSLLELRDLIFDMSLIVKADYTLVNRVDKHARVVNALITEGRGNIEEYRRHQKVDRCKYYICYGCGALVLLLVALAIFLLIR